MNHPRLLISTEDIALARTLSWVLKENAYDVVTALGKTQLFAKLEHGTYDLIVIDLTNDDAQRAIDLLTRVRERASVRVGDEDELFVITDGRHDLSSLESVAVYDADVIQRPYHVTELLARVKEKLRLGRERVRVRTEARARQVAMSLTAQVTGRLDPAEICRILVRRLGSRLPIDRCSAMLANPGDREGTLVADYEHGQVHDVRVDLTRCPEILRALETGETITVRDDDAYRPNHPGLMPWDDRPPPHTGRPLTSMIAVPVALPGGQSGSVFLGESGAAGAPMSLDARVARHVVDAAIAALEGARAADHAAVGGASPSDPADVDPLTGCGNRRLLARRLQEELDRARRYHQLVTLVFLDVGDMRRINATHGEQVGDDVLRQMAFLLRRELRGMDVLVRYGGDEFAVVLPETAAPEARMFSDRIIRRVQRHQFVDAFPVDVAVATGQATYPGDRVVDDESLIALAHDALRAAQRVGHAQ
jgi:diguanylate cyclase (GGDEF)-like protein